MFRLSLSVQELDSRWRMGQLLCRLLERLGSLPSSQQQLLFAFYLGAMQEWMSSVWEAANGEQLLIAWLYSAGMRFVINEPFLICASKGLPMLFTSAFCANFCSESIVACLALTVEGILTSYS